jgi:hypothetical protein
MNKDALALIQQLEFQNGELLKTVEMLKAEIEEYEQYADKCCYESRCNAELNKLEALCKQLRDENEQLEAERDGLSIMLTSATSAAETYKRERDALLKYITDSTWAACDICKHGIDGASVLDCKHIREVGVPCFEWRGVQKEE